MAERPREHQLEEISRREFERRLPVQWVARRQDPDYGTDYTVDVFEADGRATPLSFHVQLKATDEANQRKALRSVRFPRVRADNYWARPIPTLIVRYLAVSGAVFARWFHAYQRPVSTNARSGEIPQSVAFRLSESDRWTKRTPQDLRAGVESFLALRSPELALPVRFGAFRDSCALGSDDVRRLVFTLRRALSPIAHLVSVYFGQPVAGENGIRCADDATRVELGDVASVTLELSVNEIQTDERLAADVATAIALVLTQVGQSSLAAQVAAVVAGESGAILDPDVAATLAGAAYRSHRLDGAIALIDQLRAREEEARLTSFILNTALLARAQHLSAQESERWRDSTAEDLERAVLSGDFKAAAALAYNLGKSQARDQPEQAISAFAEAARLDSDYLCRAYYFRDLGAAQFESGMYEDASASYAEALERGHEQFTQVLYGDARLWSGHYAEAQSAIESYLQAAPRRLRDAEWRLKAVVVALLRDRVGDSQDRQPDVALARALQVDFEDEASLLTGPGAKRLLEEAISLDACCAEAWFRAAVLILGMKGDEGQATGAALVSAVLYRHNPNAWQNVIVLLSRLESREMLRDAVLAAYRFCGAELAEMLSGAPGLVQADGLLELLEEAAALYDRETREEGFTLRVPDDAGGMTEFVFGAEHDAEDTT